MSRELNILVLISGSGSNLQALIDASAKGLLGHARIHRVISSLADAYGLTRAANHQIPSQVHRLKEYYASIPKEDKEGRKAAREQFNTDLANIVVHGSKHGSVADYVRPDLVVCAGWMLILSPAFLNVVAEVNLPIINLHPALPGAFDGTHAIDRAWQAGQDGLITEGGVMIHKVIVEVDRGEPLLVKKLDLRKDETLEQYEERVHSTEHVAIVEGTKLALDEVKL
ncbi:hypothetical protein BABINDRAFT_160135 [Babjeviella inositovora NRRL Y-12698]|uniref:Phosphoribosylglycinamide formyltransferase n=1 Tax=Babjeviella inositovora NRRL Y-12698 TaxID=984486 RepID=A0A1E3QW61_9ASCO|nr:uncharacterized protein BABINDRAFT_160135 [Babjeviella inositovora NRRL Y-12698]ODQ81905.1 hypothetical protein BABINDRAFT_160135 [Babjeviella inositovora NRRL Y-12698]